MCLTVSTRALERAGIAISLPADARQALIALEEIGNRAARSRNA
ncbi:MAG: hypothetical protein WCH04_02085 [Gammaproteobacteria bacterium]